MAVTPPKFFKELSLQTSYFWGETIHFFLAISKTIYYFQQGGKQFIYFEQNVSHFPQPPPPPPPHISNGPPLIYIYIYMWIWRLSIRLLCNMLLPCRHHSIGDLTTAWPGIVRQLQTSPINIYYYVVDIQ